MANRLPKYWVVKNTFNDYYKPVLDYACSNWNNDNIGPSGQADYYGYYRNDSKGNPTLDGRWNKTGNFNDDYPDVPILSIAEFLELSQEVPDEIQTFKFC